MAERTHPVLIVDDSPDLCVSLVLLLALRGIPAVSALDGTIAMRYLRANLPPRLIVLDLRMPLMGGREFLTRLRQDPLLADIPVLVYSIVGDAGDCVDLPGVAAVFSKGADPRELLGLIERCCEDGPP